MGSNDNGAFLPSADTQASFPPQDPASGSRVRKFEDRDDLSEKRVFWITTGPESERKKAESQTSASRERTPIPEDPLPEGRGKRIPA